MASVPFPSFYVIIQHLGVSTRQTLMTNNIVLVLLQSNHVCASIIKMTFKKLRACVVLSILMK